MTMGSMGHSTHHRSCQPDTVYWNEGVDETILWDAILYKNGTPSSRMQCICWIKDLYMVLCLQKEKYMTLGTRGWKLEWPHFPSLSVTYLTNLCFSPTGCTSLEVLVPKQRLLLTKDTWRISFNYKQLFLLGTSGSSCQGTSRHEKE